MDKRVGGTEWSFMRDLSEVAVTYHQPTDSERDSPTSETRLRSWCGGKRKICAG